MSARPERAGKRLTSGSICDRFEITRRTLGRWMLDPVMQFPTSLLINNRHYWLEDDIITWERSQAVLSASKKAA